MNSNGSLNFFFFFSAVLPKLLGRESWKDFAIHGSTFFPDKKAFNLSLPLLSPWFTSLTIHTHAWSTLRLVVEFCRAKSTFWASTWGPKDIHTQWRGKKRFFWVKLLFSISILFFLLSSMIFLPVLCCHHAIASSRKVSDVDCRLLRHLREGEILQR